MKCSRCGAEIAAADKKCKACGASFYDETGAALVRSIDELVEHYGVSAVEDESELPSLFISYDNKLTKKARFLKEGDSQENAKKITGNPSIGLSEYAYLLGAEPGDTVDLSEASSEASSEQQGQAITQQEPEAEKTEPKFKISLPENFELTPLLIKIDKIIEKPADKILDLYYQKHPRPARIQRSERTERLTLLAGAVGALVVIAVLALIIIGSIAPDITGEWLIAETSSGETLTIEFTSSHKVTVRVYNDETENIYQTGSYKVRKSNGYNLLTINYDDGSEKLLYYNLGHDSGTFTNVDTNKSDTYKLIKN